MSADHTNESFVIISGNGDPDWCGEVDYREVDFCQVLSYMNSNMRNGCCYPAAFFFALNPFQCRKGAYPVPTDEGVPKSLPVLPLGFHYAQASTDSRHGRAHQGIWAKERGKIYIVPWIQSTETVRVTWDGIKRVYADADPVDDDPLLVEAVAEWARWKHATFWARDEGVAAAALEAFTVARTKLVHQCREETRARSCEPSLARSSPGTLFYNEQQSATATCPDGQTGSPITQIIPAGTVASTKSVADANAIAKKQAQTQAQQRLDCVPIPTTYWNTAQTYVASCAQTEGAPIPDGSPVTITTPANTFSSTISQADADAQALSDATTRATQGLSCTWWNSQQTASCPTGQTGDPVTIQEKTYSSQVSQADADNQAQVAARNGLTCSGGQFWNTPQIGNAIFPNCGPHRCQVEVGVEVAAHYISSNVSVADANQQALSYANGLANVKASQYCSLGQCGTYMINVP